MKHQRGTSSNTSYVQRVEAIQQFWQQHKRLPSYTEMMQLFSLKSKNAVYRVMQKLQEHGYVEKRDGKYVAGPKLMPVKILGAVEAGFPSPAEEELADAISLDEYLIRNQNATFLLRVSGESMINAGIHPEDLVLVERHKNAKVGDIVIANVDQEYTIKEYGKEGNSIVLLPANPKFKPIYPTNQMSIEGVVIAVIRKYA